MMNSPDFIIVGAMKCATSTLHAQLSLQPGICMSTLKEPNFFSDDAQYARGWDWYLSHFAAASPDDLCGESSTHYTKLPTYPHTINRIQAHLPEARFIYVMRHPIDRLVSHYIHAWTEREIKSNINVAIDTHRELVQYSQYSFQLEPYLRLFESSRILPVFHERLLSSPQAELERICSFIGFRGNPIWHTDLPAQNVSRLRLRKSRWRDVLTEAPILRTVRRRLVPQVVRNRIKAFWTMPKRPELQAGKRNELEAVFDEDLCRLGTQLGLKLTCSNFKTVARDRIPVWQ